MSVLRLPLPASVRQDLAGAYGINQTMSFPVARKHYRCEHCRRTGILPGHRYRRQVYFPGHDASTGPTPDVIRTCLSCSQEWIDDIVIFAEVHGSYCCSTWPCVRPLNHSGDCSCHLEAMDYAREEMNRALDDRRYRAVDQSSAA